MVALLRMSKFAYALSPPPREHRQTPESPVRHRTQHCNQLRLSIIAAVDTKHPAFPIRKALLIARVIIVVAFLRAQSSSVLAEVAGAGLA